MALECWLDVALRCPEFGLEVGLIVGTSILQGTVPLSFLLTYTRKKRAT
jgi:hypothetical protein